VVAAAAALVRAAVVGSVAGGVGVTEAEAAVGADVVVGAAVVLVTAVVVVAGAAAQERELQRQVLEQA